MNGILLVVLGLAWHRFALSVRAQAALFWLALYGAYANWSTTLLSAYLGTSRRTPIAGAGFSAHPWQESFVEVGLVSLSIAMVAAGVIALWGLRKGGAPGE